MKKSYLLYGVILGLLLIALEAMQYKTLIKEIELELFAAFIALLFLALGIWLGYQILEQKEKAISLNLKNAKSINLSGRELEVLTLLANGHSNQEIADKLFVSLNTIKTHISKVYQKLDVSRRTQAVQKARDLNIIEADFQT